MEHVNLEGKPCHGSVHGGQRAGLSGCLSQTTKDWMLAALRSRKLPAQIMNEHKGEVLQCARLNMPISRDTFVLPRDVYSLANIVANINSLLRNVFRH